MTRTRTSLRWLAILGVFLIIVALNACSNGLSPTPVPTPTALRTSTPYTITTTAPVPTTAETTVQPAPTASATSTHYPTPTPTPTPTPAPAEIGAAASERAVLVALFNATGGANWKNNENWLSEAPVGDWHGVTTNANDRVTKLALPENNLSGQIPAQLGSLADLQELDLWGNELIGEIPSELGNLSSLEVLILFRNRLHGYISSELGNLAKLEILVLSENRLGGEIPPQLGRLANLQTLDISETQLVGEIPSELGNLDQLRLLVLYDNRLSGEIPSELGNLIGLKELYLWGNELTGEIPSELGKLTSLDELFVAYNNLVGCVPEGWLNVPENDLESLGLPLCDSTPDVKMSAAEVYGAVSPSVPLIETPTGTGSGVLIEHGYVVTNYHVVWPYENVWVVFPDGSEILAPVVGWDPMTDMAVLGPVDAAAKPSRLVNGEGLSPGTELFLIGYPAEVEDFPKPTITRGILSRLREWEQARLTYVQTDADIAGGQSGGALVNSRGQVIGISGFGFSRAQFGLAASAADILHIINGLIDGQAAYGLGDRRPPTGRGAFTFEVRLDNTWDTGSFAVNAKAGTVLGVELDGTVDGAVRVSGPTGQLLYVDDEFGGVEQGAVELPFDGVYFVQVEMGSGDSGLFELTSTIRLKPFHDPDDRVPIEVGRTTAASLDYANDIDWFSIRLNEGETVGILADSLLVDTLVIVDFPGSRDDQGVLDDDSGGGMFGTNSWLVYRAPKSGEYQIAVSQADDSWMGGGYFLTVEHAQAGTETVHVPP